MQFVEDHWGDLNAWCLMLLGIGISLLAVKYNYNQLYILGTSSFTAGLAALKLKHIPPNGNGVPKPPETGQK